MAKDLKDQWLGLSETARLLGVHPSTVRSWADKGELPVHRTAGGHRRFRRSEVELWSAARRASQPREAQMVVQTAIGRTRLEVAEGRLSKERWYLRLSDEQRSRYRQESRHLMQGLIRAVETEGVEVQREAEVLGVAYARMGLEAGMTLREAVDAFLFFREFLMESIFNLYDTVGMRAAPAWVEMRRRVSRFTNLVLLELIEAYQAK